MPFRFQEKTRFGINAQYWRLKRVEFDDIEQTAFCQLGGWATKADFDNKGDALITVSLSDELRYAEIRGLNVRQTEQWVLANVVRFNSAVDSVN